MNYKQACKIAKVAHGDQERENGSNYFKAHCIPVAETAEKWIPKWILFFVKKNAVEELKMAAVLHDTLEDTDLTYDDLIKKGVPEFVAKVVRVLTHTKEESYLDYILRVKKDPSATMIKLADIAHNRSQNAKGNRKAKYDLADYILRH